MFKAWGANKHHFKNALFHNNKMEGEWVYFFSTQVVKIYNTIGHLKNIRNI